MLGLELAQRVARDELPHLCGKCGKGTDRATCATHGAWARQRTAWEVHGVGVRHVRGLRHTSSSRSLSPDVSMNCSDPTPASERIDSMSERIACRLGWGLGLG